VRVASTRADDVPDDVAEASTIAEEALTSYAAAGYRAPLADDDGTCGSNGGDGRLDLYLVDFAAADGSTVTERCRRVGKGTACASFMMVEARMDLRYPSAREGLRTVVPHELFHAVQNAYDAELDRFFSEGTAQLVTKRLYPELADLERHLPAFFAETSRPLDAPGGGVTAGFLYGSAVWPMFLSRSYGDTFVRRALESQAAGGGPALDATARVLSEDATTLGAAFTTFATWNVATGKRAGAGGYDDAARYPLAKVTELPAGGEGLLSGLAALYFHVAVDEERGLRLDADPARVGATWVPLEDGKAVLARAAAAPTNVTGEGIVVVTGLTPAKSDARFTVVLGAPTAPPAPAPSAPAPSAPAPSTPEDAAEGGCTMHGFSGHERTGVVGLALALAAAIRARRGRRDLP